MTAAKGTAKTSTRRRTRKPADKPAVTSWIERKWQAVEYGDVIGATLASERAAQGGEQS